MDAWLTFFSTLIWQIILITVILLFRKEMRALLGRIARFKYGETEVTFQEASSKALDPSPIAEKALQIRDEEGFFTQQGIQEIVSESKYFAKNENFRDSILVFRTEKQHTWLTVTDKQIFFILDDERTRANQRLIQYRLPLESSLPVETELDSISAGVFKLGQSDWWYYSYDLLGKPPKAKQRLEVFIKTAKA